MTDFEPLSKATVWTGEEKIGKISPIKVTAPPQTKPLKMQIKCTCIRAKSIKCCVQSRRYRWYALCWTIYNTYGNTIAYKIIFT